MNTFEKWFDTFLDEKKIPNKNFKIEHAGLIHYIDSECVLDLIRKAPANEQKEIKSILVKLDFYNGDINHFLQHLAKGYIVTNF